jgi:hypothetical protein
LPHPNSDAYTYTNTDSDGDTHADGDSYTYTHTKAYPNTKAARDSASSSDAIAVVEEQFVKRELARQLASSLLFREGDSPTGVLFCILRAALPAFAAATVE